MAFIYSMVSKGTTVLAQETSYSGNFSTVAIQCLNKCPPSQPGDPQQKLTFTADRHTFNYLVDQGFVYCVVAEDTLGRSLPYAYLERVRQEFTTKYQEKAENAIAHSMDKIFGPRLKANMEYVVSHPEEFNKVALVQRKVDDVRSVMVDNIDKVLDRGDKIEHLVDKTENMKSQADKFHKVGRQLRDKMWWQNFRSKLFFFMIAFVVIFFIFASVCFGGGNCLAGGSSGPPAPAPAAAQASAPAPAAEPAASASAAGGGFLG
uniref:V-SNARE coiled-coil homology domain-containing protein n=1 Tax=Tetraselmis chuii TaxID=63592 RepID=A0A7S1X5C1_9CHLO|mmetsp:Transcript_30058/g.53752  ORF Transcript_30058/g.53752 Transcript_30058/m.53752 type:complete len:262 (+) Transcript_30058:542-1327(+)